MRLFATGHDSHGSCLNEKKARQQKVKPAPRSSLRFKRLIPGKKVKSSNALALGLWLVVHAAYASCLCVFMASILLLLLYAVHLLLATNYRITALLTYLFSSAPTKILDLDLTEKRNERKTPVIIPAILEEYP